MRVQLPSIADIATELLTLSDLYAAGITPESARRSAVNFLRMVARDERDAVLHVDPVTRVIASVFHDCLRAGRHLSLVTPPGLGKSSLARWLMLREIGRRPHLRSVVISADVTDAINSVSLCRQVLLSTAYQQTYPRAKPDYDRSMDARGWKQGEWFLRVAGQRKDPTMAAKAAIPKGTGFRVDMLLADDVMTQRTAEEPWRSSIVDAFFKTWIDGRLSLGGWCCHLQNVWNDLDLAHQLRDHPAFCSVWIGVDKNLKSLFVRVWNPPDKMRLMDTPEKFSATRRKVVESLPMESARFGLPLPTTRKGFTPEDLKQKTPSSLASLYHLIANRPEDLMLRSWPLRDRFPGTVPEMLRCEEDLRGLPIFKKEHWLRFQIAAGIDLSSKKRKGSAVWVLVKDASGRVMPVELHVGAFTIADIVKILRDMQRRGIRPTIVNVENNGTQDLIVESLAAFKDAGEGDEWARRILPFQTDGNKHDPNIGLPAIEVDVSQGVLLWPEKESARELPHAGEWLAFEQELLTLPRILPMITPDRLMAFWFARRALDQLGLPGKRQGAATSSGDRSERQAF